MEWVMIVRHGGSKRLHVGSHSKIVQRLNTLAQINHGCMGHPTGVIIVPERKTILCKRTQKPVDPRHIKVRIVGDNCVLGTATQGCLLHVANVGAQSTGCFAWSHACRRAVAQRVWVFVPKIARRSVIKYQTAVPRNCNEETVNHLDRTVSGNFETAGTDAHQPARSYLRTARFNVESMRQCCHCSL